MWTEKLLKTFFSLLLALGISTAVIAQERVDYRIGAGDVVRVQVFQNQDLTVEARVSESGVISYPLLGVIKLGGLSPTDAERLIARRLKRGNFLQNPQVTLNVLQFRSQQVSVLGNVTNPGRFALETTADVSRTRPSLQEVGELLLPLALLRHIVSLDSPVGCLFFRYVNQPQIAACD